MSPLVDQLANRLGAANVVRLASHESYLPERAVYAVPVLKAGRDGRQRTWDSGPAWFVNRPRPVSLFHPPQPVEAMAPVPDDPPVLFRWRRVVHRVARADGPERIAPEWWREEAREIATRDYFRIEDSHGRRFWLYRNGLYQPRAPAPEPRWYLHGIFA